MQLKRIVPAALFSFALLFRIFLFFNVGYFADDALITFRYAENLATGSGFVYNEGQHVLGTTTPLFTLLLAALLKLGMNPFFGALLLNIIADLVSAWILLIAFRDAPQPLKWIPSFLFLFIPPFLHWSVSGMETEFCIAILLGSFFAACRDRWMLAFALGGLAIVARIDGIAIPAALTIAYLARKKSVPWAPIAITTLIVLPWALFAWSYFGSPIPNSVTAKWALAGQGRIASAAQILLRGFLHLHSFGGPLLLLAITGTIWIWRRGKEWFGLVVWTAAYALAYSLAGGPMHPWYYTPFCAGYLFLCSMGAWAVLNRFPRMTAPAVTAALGVAAICIVLLLSYFEFGDLNRAQEGTNALNRATGIWLRDHTPADSVVAFKDIGAIGYYSHRKVLDLAGLVSPECIPFRAREDYLGPIRQFRPGYFVFSAGQAKTLGLENTDLMGAYKLAQEVQVAGGSSGIYQLR